MEKGILTAKAEYDREDSNLIIVTVTADTTYKTLADQIDEELAKAEVSHPSGVLCGVEKLKKIFADEDKKPIPVKYKSSPKFLAEIREKVYSSYLEQRDVLLKRVNDVKGECPQVKIPFMVNNSVLCYLTAMREPVEPISLQYPTEDGNKEIMIKDVANPPRWEYTYEYTTPTSEFQQYQDAIAKIEESYAKRHKYLEETLSLYTERCMKLEKENISIKKDLEEALSYAKDLFYENIRLLLRGWFRRLFNMQPRG